MQHLKGLAHHLNPVVMIGNNGLTEGVLAEIEIALAHHELIKSKSQAKIEMLKLDQWQRLCVNGAQNGQVIGKMVVLYRPSEARKIILPK
nr:YhbY family RNA-binding protein [Proteus mirabilis]